MVQPQNNALQRYLSKRFRILLTGDADGVPPWLATVGESDEQGLYLPDEAPWIAHADMATLVGGIRALLMQPFTRPNRCRQHSRYKSDPLGRLSGTIRWLTVTTRLHFSLGRGRTGGQNASAREGKIHGLRGRPSTTRRPILTSCVGFTLPSWIPFSGVSASPPPLPGRADAYINLWSKSVVPLGLTEVPMSEAELLADRKYRPELVVNDNTREVIRWIKYPPLPKTSLPAYRFLSKPPSLPCPGIQR